MNMGKYFVLGMGLVVGLWGATVRASHEEGTVARLVEEAHELQEQIHRARMERPVQRAVRLFVMDSERLLDCADYAMSRDPRGMRVDLEVPRQCADHLRETRASFADLEMALRSSGVLNPVVRRQYLVTNRALDRLRVGTGHGPGDRRVSCTAVDRGFEEHFGGHEGVGLTVERAQRAALLACRRHHDRCEIRSCRTVR